MENDFLRRAFKRVKEARSKNSVRGETRCTGEVMQLEGKSGLSIVEACDSARLSRAGFYRDFDEHAPRHADMELREQIQQICPTIAATGLGASQPHSGRRVDSSTANVSCG